MEFGLVGHGTAECGGAVVLAGDGEAAEPGRPVPIEVSVDTELVGRGCRGIVRRAHDLTAATGCVVVFLRAVHHSDQPRPIIAMPLGKASSR